MRQKWLIRLGAQEWQRFTHLPPDSEGIELIGSVRRGAQMGALARLPDQRYVQINGDFMSALSQAQIRRALAQAQTAPPSGAFRLKRGPANRTGTSPTYGTSYTPEAGAAPQQPQQPTVIIKRRRRLVQP